MSSGRSDIVSGFVMACLEYFHDGLCSVVLEGRHHPEAWSQYLSNVLLHMMHYLVWFMMGTRSLRWMSSVNNSLCNRFEGLLCGKL